MKNSLRILKPLFAQIKADKSALTKLYIPLASLVFILPMALNLYYSPNVYFTVAGLQIAFSLLLIFTILFAAYLFIKGKLNISFFPNMVMTVGIGLRICYTLYTGAGTRTYDVYRDSWGHLDYIKHIAQNFSLPTVNECQTYHPPVHHIISAFSLNLGKLFTSEEFIQLKFIQLIMVLLSSLTLIVLYKILKELKCNDYALATGLSFFAFHPTNIYFSSRINNDNTMFFFYTLALYYLIKWLKNNTFKNVALLSLSASLSFLTKFSGIMLVPLIAFAFLITLIRSYKDYKILFRQFAVFAFIYIPLSISYPIRNYVLFHQKFGYVPSFGRGFTPSLYNTFYIPLSEMLKNPFNNGGIKGGEFFLEFLLKSSLFGEWRYPGLEPLARAMILLTVIITTIILVYTMLYIKNVNHNLGYLLLLNLLVPFLLEIKFRTDLPVACSQDFRYIAPVLISSAYFLGKAASHFWRSRLWLVKFPIITLVITFCTLSVALILSLGYYN